MTDKPKISIVMLNYNGIEFLKRTIQPLLELNYSDYEVILVDNGSEDGSQDFIRSFKKIRFIETEPVGHKNHACNVAINKAKGEYVLLIDNDILIEDKEILNKLDGIKSPDKIVQVPMLNEGEKDTSFYGIFYSFYGPGSFKKAVPIEKILEYPEDEFYIGAPYAGVNFFQKSTWNKIGGYDEIQSFVMDDADIGPRAWIMGVKCVLYTKSYFIHLGIDRRENLEYLIRRFRLRFSGLCMGIIKNYKWYNILRVFPFFFLFQLIQAIRYSIKRKSVKILLAFIYSIFKTIENLPYTLEQRKWLQKNRVEKKDVFQTIDLPKELKF